MKLLLMIALTMLSLNLYAADSVERAEELHDLRGEDVENAKLAADMYGRLAEAETENTEKARLYYEQSGCLAFYGTEIEGNDNKEEIHETGANAATSAIDLLEGNIEDYEQEELLASSYYVYGSNKGKWAEARGIMASLGNWPKLKETMNKIIDMGFEDVHDYGANRILGRAYYKLPALAGGSNKKSLAYLQDAFDNTLNDEGNLSLYGLHNVYLADTLKAVKKKDQACQILKDFVEVDAETFNEERIPETKGEIEMAREKIADFGC